MKTLYDRINESIYVFTLTSEEIMKIMPCFLKCLAMLALRSSAIAKVYGKLTCLSSRVLGSKWFSPLNSFFGGFPQPLPIYVSQSPKFSGPTAHYICLAWHFCLVFDFVIVFLFSICFLGNETTFFLGSRTIFHPQDSCVLLRVGVQ